MPACTIEIPLTQAEIDALIWAIREAAKKKTYKPALTSALTKLDACQA